VLGARGVVRTLSPELDEGERRALRRSAEVLAEAGRALDG
jgi:malate/lactate dehydrogenase